MDCHPTVGPDEGRVLDGTALDGSALQPVAESRIFRQSVSVGEGCSTFGSVGTGVVVTGSGDGEGGVDM
jgi:hypothetical protein